MSKVSAAIPLAPERPKFSALRWAVVRYLDGEMGNALDQARARLSTEARKEREVVAEWVKSPSLLERTQPYQQDTNRQDGTPIMGERRYCVVYLVAVCKAAPPEKWVRLTTANGPAAVEVATVETRMRTVKGGAEVREQVISKVETYHPEDMRHVAMGYAQRALEGVE